MSYYDHYKERGKTKWRVKLQQDFLSSLLKTHSLEPGPSAALLEIGPGTGAFAEIAKEFGYRYSAVEPNKDLADSLSSRGFSVELGSCPPLSHANDSFDVVYSSHVIEHLPGPSEAHEFISECLRVLKPGGRLVLLAPDQMRMGNYFWDCDYTHRFPITERRMRQLLADAAFANSSVHAITEPFVGKVKYLIDSFMALYPYRLLERLSPCESLATFFYKIRSTFTPSVLAIAVKPKAESE